MIQKTHNPNILLTAFRGTSGESLIKNTENYKTLFLPNDKIKDSKKLIEAISKEKFDYVISFGQRPNIKNKVHIETTARDGEIQINTNFDCEKLRQLFEQNGMIAKISHNAGTSFCNEVYLNGLRYIFQNDLDTQMVFVHIPFAKNIDDLDDLRRKILGAIASI